MQQETVDHIIKYYSHLLPDTDKRLLRHLLHREKLFTITDAHAREIRKSMYERHNWLVTDKKLLEKLADGPEAFRYNAAIAVFNAHGGEKLLNLCPRCGLLARTPDARQCRHCGHDWH